MIAPSQIITLPPARQSQPDNKKILLSDIVTPRQDQPKDRLPFFAENKGSGAAKCVVHLSKIENISPM